MQSPPFPRYLVPPRSKYSLQHHVLKHPQLPFLPQCQRPSFTPIQNNRQNYTALYVNFPLFWSDFKESLIFSTDFSKKYSNIKFHANPSSGRRTVACRRTDGRTDMTKLIVAFRNFAKVPKNSSRNKTLMPLPLTFLTSQSFHFTRDLLSSLQKYI